MLKLAIVVVAILAVANSASFDFFVPPAGRCKPGITSVPFNFSAAIEVIQWEMSYVPDHSAYSNFDSIYRDILWTTSNTKAYFMERFRGKDLSVRMHFYTFTYGSDHIVYEERVYCSGLVLWVERFRCYVLDFDPNDSAIFYYRCSDFGYLGIDTRFIKLPRGNTLSAATEQQFLTKDATYGFTGGIRRLENNYRF